MQILKVISLLLDYPQTMLLRENQAELEAAIAAAREISPAMRQPCKGCWSNLSQTS
jgi:nitrate reductase assembly molybdenum cofactor insertion protein NarJ